MVRIFWIDDQRGNNKENSKGRKMRAPQGHTRLARQSSPLSLSQSPFLRTHKLRRPHRRFRVPVRASDSGTTQQLHRSPAAQRGLPSQALFTRRTIRITRLSEDIIERSEQEKPYRLALIRWFPYRRWAQTTLAYRSVDFIANFSTQGRHTPSASIAVYSRVAFLPHSKNQVG